MITRCINMELQLSLGAVGLCWEDLWAGNWWLESGVNLNLV
jgi:hypothetical protein